MKRIYKYIFLVITIVLIISKPVRAQEITHIQKDINLIFVLDSSYSMNVNNKNKIAEEIIYMFVDNLPSKDTKIGYVAYNDSITTFLKPTTIKKHEERVNIKNRIKSIRKTGYSDMGLGMKKGFELVREDLKENSQPIMILISDGETSLSRNSNRTETHSELDMEEIVKKANGINMPIYTISLDKNHYILEGISRKTKGKMYDNPSSGDLINIFKEISENYSTSTVKPFIEIKGTGKKQDISISVKESYRDESNILVISSEPIREANIIGEKKDFHFSKSKYYFSVKIVGNKEGELLLNFITRKNAKVKVYKLSNYNANLILHVPDKIYKNKSFKIDAYFNMKMTSF
ncbi:MAG: VWA domain-containing protein [Anaeromicrobium sp.]|jgi:uncharacterized protein YegL|uniref:vWA domain-containing protein n=1 Tax=Anaeromicrobium sp. TaxID=1929132 RepID=UPI0025FC728A|nr:vWA domain-containing protein [Anaeromicrobium sp.]MCT4595552.1 VWA domain-containing protein [Anaeromicrobium sp.]